MQEETREFFSATVCIRRCNSDDVPTILGSDKWPHHHVQYLEPSHGKGTKLQNFSLRDPDFVDTEATVATTVTATEHIVQLWFKGEVELQDSEFRQIYCRFKKKLNVEEGLGWRMDRELLQVGNHPARTPPEIPEATL